MISEYIPYRAPHAHTYPSHLLTCFWESRLNQIILRYPVQTREEHEPLHPHSKLCLRIKQETLKLWGGSDIICRPVFILPHCVYVYMPISALYLSKIVWFIGSFECCDSSNCLQTHSSGVFEIGQMLIMICYA